MDMKKISAACATAAALAALCVPGSAFAADGTLHPERGRRQPSPDTASPCTRSLDTTTSSRTART